MGPSRSEDEAKMAPRVEWNQKRNVAEVPKPIVKHMFFVICRGGGMNDKWSQDGGAWGHRWAPVGANMGPAFSQEGPRCDQDGAKIRPRWRKMKER